MDECMISTYDPAFSISGSFKASNKLNSYSKTNHMDSASSKNLGTKFTIDNLNTHNYT